MELAIVRVDACAWNCLFLFAFDGFPPDRDLNGFGVVS